MANSIVVTSRVDPQELAGVLTYFEAENPDRILSRSEVLSFSLSMLHDILMVSGKIEKRLSKADALDLLEERYPRIQVTQPRKNRLKDRLSLHEEADIVRESLEQIERLKGKKDV